MEWLGISLIWMIFILFLSKNNKNKQGKQNKKLNERVIYSETIIENGKTINKTYTNDNIEENINENIFEDSFENTVLDQWQNANKEMNEVLENSISRSNNRHSFMYQDIEKEIIKVDHTFSKEIFLNNAKELFYKYYDAMVKEESEELKEYLTESFLDIIQDRINENKENNISVVAENIYIYNAFLYEFSKSTYNQIITVKIIAEMKNYEIDTKTQFIVKGNKYVVTRLNYEMQFKRKTESLKCKSCGAPVNTKDLSVCEYCNTPIKVKANEWKLNYINILKD